MQDKGYPVDARGWTDEKGASAHTGLSVSWFQKARHLGNGPAYVKPGGGRSVRYSFAALDAFMSNHARTSTADEAA